jgi:predicted Zn-dependent protease
VCLLAAGYVLGRQIWAEVHCRRAEEALGRSLCFPGRAQLAEARQHLACSLEVWPDHARLHFLMARAARRAGDHDVAAAHLRRAAELGWVAEAVDLEKVLMAVQQGRLERWEPLLVSFVRRDHPDKRLILEALVQGCRQTYQLPRALAYLDDWLASQPDSARALVWRGETLLALGRQPGALADFRQAVELDPQEDETRLKLADLLLSFRRPAEALTHLTELQQRHPDQEEVLFGLARCRAELGEADEATLLLDRLLSLRPDHAGALAERGKLALQADRPLEAEKWLRRAAAAAPFEREVLHALHGCLVHNGHAREAADYRARIERIDEDRKQLDQLKRAIMTSPHDASLRSEMGRLLLRNGQEKEGLRWLHSALREDPAHGPTRRILEEHQR